MSYWIRYTDNDGWCWAVYNAGDPSKAPRVGPPDLSGLNLEVETLHQINNRLVDLGIVDGHTLLNRRHDIRVMLRQLGLDTSLERTITGIYQSTYY